MSAGPPRGWCLVAFDGESAGELTPAAVGDTRLAVVRDPTGVRVVAADCPHRGAHLGHGRLDGDRIVCPFHGHRIGLGTGSGCRFRVPEYAAVRAGGLLFARLTDDHDHGFGARITELARTHHLIEGFTVAVAAGAAWVVENGVDQAHFGEVHGIGTRPGLEVGTGDDGELVATGAFTLPRAAGSGHGPGGVPVRIGYEARCYSPWLIVARLGGPRPYTVLTGATPQPGGGCEVRVALAVPAGDGPPDPRWCREILRGSRDGLERDRLVWERLAPAARWEPTPQDAPVLAFREFCRGFGHEPEDGHGAGGEAPVAAVSPPATVRSA